MKLIANGLRRLPDTEHVILIARIGFKDRDETISMMDVLDIRDNDETKIEKWFKRVSEETKGVTIDSDIIWVTEYEKQKLFRILSEKR